MAAKTLYIGNLPYGVSEARLVDVFQTYGGTNPRIIENRGFGFIDIEADKFEAAVADKNNSDLDGRTITVNEARPRESRSDSGYGGNRSGGGGGRSRY